ncbi:MAG: exodeoxyribonuclease VII large subunit [Bacteroidales bacterium]|nr:exodeoxyribonuclease VII large subunit [Bacteroidales bacterium]
MNEKLSLTELQLIIRDSLYEKMPGFYWVYAEISEVKENFSGHCYLELVEKHPDDINLSAKIRAIIWNTRYRFIKPFFESATGETLKAGLKILVRAKIEYHEVYGLSLVINDIDPAFTIGEMALKRRQILLRLEEEGVISMNKELELPLAPKRIAIISSKGAAGYTDFIKHLICNIYGYTFQTELFEAVMQGTETEESVISALDKISEKIDRFDLVVIIRGGGSQTDLSWFDNYNIAYHITQFPLPVITGIGHEKDLSVTDIVAFHSLKTPTAVADFIIERMVSAEKLLTDLASEISGIVKSAISENKEKLNTMMMRMIPNANMIISSEKERLSSLILDLINTGKENLHRKELIFINYTKSLQNITKDYVRNKETRISRAEEILKMSSYNCLKTTNSILTSISNSLNIISPINVLKRGYTITVSNRMIIKSVEELEKGKIIDTILYDGKIKSIIENKRKYKFKT